MLPPVPIRYWPRFWLAWLHAYLLNEPDGNVSITKTIEVHDGRRRMAVTVRTFKVKLSAERRK